MYSVNEHIKHKEIATSTETKMETRNITKIASHVSNNNVEILGRKKNTNKIQDRKKIESHELKTLRKSTIMFYR